MPHPGDDAASHPDGWLSGDTGGYRPVRCASPQVAPDGGAEYEDFTWALEPVRMPPGLRRRDIRGRGAALRHGAGRRRTALAAPLGVVALVAVLGVTLVAVPSLRPWQVQPRPALPKVAGPGTDAAARQEPVSRSSLRTDLSLPGEGTATPSDPLPTWNGVLGTGLAAPRLGTTPGPATTTTAPPSAPTATSSGTSTSTTASTTATPTPSSATTTTASTTSVSSAPTTSTSSSSAPGTTAADLVTQVLDLTNAERAKAGCSALVANAALVAAAQGHAADMVAKQYFDHTGKAGSTPTTRAAAVGYSGGVGENIASGYATAAAVMTGWMNSAGHRANILNCSYKTIGIGYDAGAVQANFGPGTWVQDFGLSDAHRRRPGPAPDQASDVQ